MRDGFAPNWPGQSTVPVLGSHEVHLWCIDLARPKSEVKRLWPLLSADEKARAERFAFEALHDHYVVGRGVLRTLIGKYTATPAQAVQFVYGEQGKPAITESDLQFNLSHSERVALAGFCRRREIGVDVERLQRLSDADAVAKRFFSAEEYAAYCTVPYDEQPQAFFNCWTRKEAFIKAIGEGLTFPLGSFAVTLRPGEPLQLLHIRQSRTAAAEWSLQALDPAAGYVGAVIANGEAWQARCFTWIY